MNLFPKKSNERRLEEKIMKCDDYGEREPVTAFKHQQKKTNSRHKIKVQEKKTKISFSDSSFTFESFADDFQSGPSRILTNQSVLHFPRANATS